MTLIGPFHQLLTLDGLPTSGPIQDKELAIFEKAGIIVDDEKIIEIDSYETLKKKTKSSIQFNEPVIAIPGIIDAHTHLCYAGNRVEDYAQRVAGATYQEIARLGGGILDTVNKTRKATENELIQATLGRLDAQLAWGITTCEIKSGYGLSVEEELKLLRAIQQASLLHPIQIISTCLAAHVKPKEIASNQMYLETLVKELFPQLKELTNRIDIFVEEGAFSIQEARLYLQAAKEKGYALTLHANQFSKGGASLAAELKAYSADHLEYLTEEECKELKKNTVSAIVLPGASIGLGVPFAPARMMLNNGLSVAIASDWNPGSAPMGNLVLQAAVLGAKEKLTLAETLAGITIRAAQALRLPDRGLLKPGFRADLTVYPARDWREIFYYQGTLLAAYVFIGGKKII